MADIIQTSTYKQTGAVPLVYTTLGASTTFQLYPDMPQTLVIFNDTAAPVTPILVGDDASTQFAVSGVGLMRSFEKTKDVQTDRTQNR